MYTFDHDLFSALNFDGVMLTVSGTAMWLPLYALILWLVWRRSGWRGMLIFTALMLAAIGLADMVSGIFKSNGVLGGLLPDFEPRPRPMFTPSLEGLDITPDSLRVMRREEGHAAGELYQTLPQQEQPEVQLRSAGLDELRFEDDETEENAEN